MAEDIKWALEEEDVRWTMAWTPREQYPEKPAEEPMFEEAAALSHLLMNEVVFLNSHWFEKDWPKAAQDGICVCVNCNDVFAWGCADAEGLPYKEIQALYEMWRKDPVWGPAVWCVRRRGQMPQKPVEARIRAAGIWDLDALSAAENTQDAEVHAFVRAVLAKVDRTEPE